MLKLLLSVCIVFLLMISLVVYKRVTSVADYIDSPELSLKVRSSAFEDGSKIPVKYTGEGADISPGLQLSKIDSGAKSFAIIMDDLDHPLGVYNHWLIWNISAEYDYIPEGLPREEIVLSLGNAIQGRSSYGGKHYYRGPKPPFNLSHKYVFKVYVLDITLNLDKNAGKKELQKAMDGHIMQYGTLTGVFH